MKPATKEALRAYRQFADSALCAPIVADLEDEFGRAAFCAENMYLTAHALGSVAVLQHIQARIDEASRGTLPTLPQETTKDG